MDHWISQLDALLVTLLLAATMLAGWGLAWWSGKRVPTDAVEPSTGRFVDGSLTMMALLLGFTFAMALSKHDQRRLMVIADSNSIGDFYSCASLLKDPVRTQLQTLIRVYVDHRLDVVRKNYDRVEFEEALQQIPQMQNRMLQLVNQAVDEGTPVTVPLVNTYNALTSNHAARLAAVRDRVPGLVVLLLCMSAAIASMLVGRYHGLRHKPHIFSTLCYILIVVSAIYIVLDLNQPSGGLLRATQEPMERLAASIAAK